MSMGHDAPPSRPAATIRADERDNTATALRPLAAGAVLAGGLSAREEVPPGHKLALRDIRRGEPVLKAGLPIGLAAVDIPAGAHLRGELLAGAVGERPGRGLRRGVGARSRGRVHRLAQRRRCQQGQRSQGEDGAFRVVHGLHEAFPVLRPGTNGQGKRAVYVSIVESVKN